MKEFENKVRFIGENNDPEKTADMAVENKSNKDRIKKSLIFGLMGIVFVACIYLIFKPSTEKKTLDNIGLNDAVPDATGAGMQADKQKAYEQDILEQKDQEKRNALTTLSDYWNTEPKEVNENEPPEQSEKDLLSTRGNNFGRSTNPTLHSYQHAQNTLGAFYQDNNTETKELRRQLDELKEKLAEREIPKAATVDDQLTLMEKSYEMAAKYLPKGTHAGSASGIDSIAVSSSPKNQKESFVSFTPIRKNTVSALFREPNDSTFIADWNQNRNRDFYTAGATDQVVKPKNSIKASVSEEQILVGEAGVRLRLLEAARTPNRVIPAGTIVTAMGKFQSGRLQLKINSIEFEGNIIPVDITIYDVDGQAGLYVPFSPEMNALTEMAGNMSQTSGQSIMLTQSAGQQIGADLSRGVVQGISGYFAKKVKTPKVTIKAGHQVFLVSKK